MIAFMSVIKNIGIPTTEDKKKGQTIVLIFCGLVIDTELMVVLFGQIHLVDWAPF